MRRLHVISTSYNSNRFAINNICSVSEQSIQPFSHVYIDDMSSDNSVEILNTIINSEIYLTASKKYSLKITINKEKKYKIRNLLEILKDTTTYKNNDIVCILDGDDWLSNRDALKEVYEAYEKDNLDYLYTNWMYSHNRELGISKIIPSNEIGRAHV